MPQIGELSTLKYVTPNELGLGCKATYTSLWEQYGLVALAQAGTAAWPQREGGLCPCLLLAECGPKGA